MLKGGVMRRVSRFFWATLIIALCDLCSAQTFPKPGPEHEALKKMEGTWDARLTLPGNLKGTGTMTCKMECGGLWLARDLNANLGGLKLQTKCLDGYDPIKKKHISVQFDSMTTVPMTLQGDYDPATKTLTQTGETRDFDGSPEQVKSVFKQLDDDRQSVDVYRVYPDGRVAKHLTIEYTRRKEVSP
jgi:hypothetical protein